MKAFLLVGQYLLSVLEEEIKRNPAAGVFNDYDDVND
jgi:hypothetical protein